MTLNKPEQPTTYITFRQKGVPGTKTITLYNATKTDAIDRVTRALAKSRPNTRTRVA